MVSSRALLRNRLEDFGIKMCYIRVVHPLIPPTSSTFYFVDIYPGRTLPTRMYPSTEDFLTSQ